MPPDLRFDLSIIFYGEEGNESTRGAKYCTSTRGVLSLDIRDVIYCHVLETQPFVNTRGVVISRAYVTFCSGVELQIPKLLPNWNN